VAQGANWLAFIVNAMKPDLLANKKLGSDDTPVPVLAKGKTRQGYLWVYRSDGSTGIACTIYDFTPTRSQQGPLNFLVGYQGYLQADAYAGYDALYAQGHVIEVACFAHAKRKFFDIAKALNGLQSDADEALHFIGQLYQIERAAKGFTIKTRYYYRRRYAKPLLKKLRRWLRKKKRVYLPKTPLAGAINYMLNQWRALMHYLREGFLDIDNNGSERAIRPITVGRKNYLFYGSDEGGRRAANIYSIIETCKQHQVNTFDYLQDILTRLPTHPNARIRELLPYNWKPNPQVN